MDKVIVKCYGKEKEYERNEAIRTFALAVQVCEGSEQERYANILSDLVLGKSYCTDRE